MLQACRGRAQPGGRPVEAAQSLCFPLHNDPDLYPGHMAETMDRDIVRSELLRRTHEKDGRRRIGCREAQELAATLGVAHGLVGEICDQEDVRICDCQLGCFR